MCNRLRALFSLCVLLMLVGCETFQPLATSSVDSVFLRGVIVPEKEHFIFTPCFSREQRSLRDDSSQLLKRYQEQVVGNSLPVYVELYARQQEDLVWQVQRVLLAGGGSQACEYELQGIQYRAAGADPLWIADVLETGVRVQSYNNLTQLTFPLQEGDGERGKWEGELTSTKGKSFYYTLQIREASCRDEQGAWYSLAATLELDGTLFVGCARAGNLNHLTLAGRYSNGLSAERVFVVLDIQGDSGATMMLDYRNGLPLTVWSGQWQWRKNGKLLLDFSKEQGPLLIFKRGLRGNLEQEGFSPALGKGLRLQRAD